jgi:TRAP-type mannitol/chloroaromatic compound transport system permease small subunit
MNGLEKFYGIIGSINNVLGKACGWLIFPMMLLVAFEVTMRYIFVAPTIWTYEFSTQMLAVMGGLGAGYGLLTDSHVRVDIFSKKLPGNGKAILDVITDILTVLVIGCLTVYLIREAATSTASLERSVTVWHPPVYPERIIIAIGFVMLTLQAICTLLKNVTLLFVKRNPKKEVVPSGVAS